MAQQYTNIRLILDKTLRHPLMKDMSFETAVDYTVDFLRIVGVPDMFNEKTQILEIKLHRAMLPCDYYQMIQVRKCEGPVFRYSNDSFHYREKDCYDEISNLTYKIQGNVIFTTLKDGKIEISYRAIAVDEEGYPLLPDNSSFTRALEYYLKMKHFEVLYDMGKIQPQVFQNVLQQYAWAVGDCQSEFSRLSIDKAESLFNSWHTLLLRRHSHADGFKHSGDKEIIKIH